MSGNGFKAVVNTEILADKTVREVERIDRTIQNEIIRRGGMAAIKAGLPESIGIPQDIAIASMYVWRQIGQYRYTEKGASLTIRQLSELMSETSEGFLRQHVANYAAYYVIEDFYDWLAEKKLIARFSKTEGYWRKLDAEFRDYERQAIGSNEHVSKMVFMDYVTQSFGAISPLVDALEVAVRDYLIPKRDAMVAAGQKDDIATIQKVAVCMHFVANMQQSFKKLFTGIVKEHGVDFSSKFRYAVLSKMARNFIYMCEAQGVKFVFVNDVEMNLLGVDINKSVRVSAAWKTITNTLNDEDFTNDIASRVFEMNPEVNREYEEAFAEIEAEQAARKQQEMEEGFRMLEEKFKVTKL